ncbi:hypothetical protein WA158_007873 [Blastocystis sp. Blastoise]
MSDAEFHFTDDKYLFTFQDETQLWIPKRIIEEYPQLPFQNLIQHSDKYGDGSYYIDMLPFHMEKVIHFLMEENIDVLLFNLRDSFDIYKIFVEYSVVISKEIQRNLIFHIEELFVDYLNENNYRVYVYNNVPSFIMEYFSSTKKKLSIHGLITPEKQKELLYYELLFKMMNITEVDINYEYASNIPIEYICPSCIQDIFPSLKELRVTVTTNYVKSDKLLNPNSDEYIMEYCTFCDLYGINPKIKENCEYYSESEMNNYNKISSFIYRKYIYPYNVIDSYKMRKELNKLPKLYERILNEAIYINDYSQIETNQQTYDYVVEDQICEYNDNTGDNIFSIEKLNTECGFYQLLHLPICYSISQINVKTDNYSEIFAIPLLNAFKDGIFDSITSLGIRWFSLWNASFADNQFLDMITTHVFPNVTKLIYDFDIISFPLKSINSKCFPKLHIIDYEITIHFDDLDNLFPNELMSIIDTIYVSEIFSDKQNIYEFLDNLVYTHSIHINGIDGFIDYFPHSTELLEKGLIYFDNKDINIESYESIEDLNLDYYYYNINNKIDSLEIRFGKNDEDINNYIISKENKMKCSLEKLFNSHLVQHLQSYCVSFEKNISIKELKWINSLFKENTFNIPNIKGDLLTDTFPLFQRSGYTHIINQLICNGYFHNINKFILYMNDISEDICSKVYTKENFPKLKYIHVEIDGKEKWLPFIQQLYSYFTYKDFQPSFNICFKDTAYIGGKMSILYNIDSILEFHYDSSLYSETLSIHIYQLAYKLNNEIEALFDFIGKQGIQQLKRIKLYIYYETVLHKIIDMIINEQIPNLNEFICSYQTNISQEQLNMYKQQLSNSSFIQKNHGHYEFYKC